MNHNVITSSLSKSRKIGLIGGVSWKTTAFYYEHINTRYNQIYTSSQSPHLVIESLDFEKVSKLLHGGDIEGLSNYLYDAASSLAKAGADAIFICCNTVHKVLPRVSIRCSIPIVSICKTAASKLKAEQVSKVALLGTRFTMEEDFYRVELENSGIECIIPDEADRKFLHDVIFGDLCIGKVTDDARRKMRAVIENVVAAGAQAILLACTELPLLTVGEDFGVPIIDSSYVHAEEAVTFLTQEKC